MERQGEVRSGIKQWEGKYNGRHDGKQNPKGSINTETPPKHSIMHCTFRNSWRFHGDKIAYIMYRTLYTAPGGGAGEAYSRTRQLEVKVKTMTYWFEEPKAFPENPTKREKKIGWLKQVNINWIFLGDF